MKKFISLASLTALTLLVAGCGNENQALYDEYHSIYCKIPSSKVTGSDSVRITEIQKEFEKLASDKDHAEKLKKAQDLSTCK